MRPKLAHANMITRCLFQTSLITRSRRNILRSSGVEAFSAYCVPVKTRLQARADCHGRSDRCSSPAHADRFLLFPATKRRRSRDCRIVAVRFGHARLFHLQIPHTEVGNPNGSRTLAGRPLAQIATATNKNLSLQTNWSLDSICCCCNLISVCSGIIWCRHPCSLWQALYFEWLRS